MTIVAICLQVELVILNEPREFLGQETLQGLFPLISIGPSHGHEGSLTQVMNVTVETLDGHFLILVVTQEVESFGQELIHHDRLGYKYLLFGRG
jgi:hypothetical protein